MNYGFVIDTGRCIGCHACSTACKSENQVPVGVHRTWVKTVQRGQYPDVRRNFQVTRCNHCANPPCVRICPTAAMVQRDDGIVEFDGDACIGCKGCIQACPYDAVYLDPETRTAAKCHFCAHRVDVGLEPACVVVCPEHAILAGDLDDPESEVAQAVASRQVVTRRPEQGTAPKLFYIDGDHLSLHPDVRPTADSMMFSDVVDTGAGVPSVEAVGTRRDARGENLRIPGSQGLPVGGPVQIGSRQAEHMVQVAWDAQHDIHWHWPIPAYIVTKHVAGGAAALLSLAAVTQALPLSSLAMVSVGGLALLSLAITLVLLVYDLDRPDRFFYLLIRPQWRSWIARAAWILTGFAMVFGVWWSIELLAWLGAIDPSVAATARVPLAVVAGPLGVLVAVYTGFLFAQAEGRDLWQSSHVPVQMLAHMAVLATGAVVGVSAFVELPEYLVEWSSAAMLLALIGSAVITGIGDFGVPQASEAARRAQRILCWGKYRAHYWLGGVCLGHVVPIVLLTLGTPVAGVAAFLCAALGLFAYSYAFVLGPQELPNS